MKRFVLVVVSLVLALGGLLGPATAVAVESKPLVLQTSPLPINLSVPPGKSVSTDLRVKQNSGTNERLKVSLMKFTAFGEEGKPRLMDRGPGDDYFDWAKFDKTSFDAPNNVWQTVKMTINVPKTAAFGYYYAVVFSRVGDDVNQGPRTTAIAGGSAVLVLLDAVSPNAKRSLEVASFSSKHRIYEFLPTHFDVKLSNKGNVHAVPHGDIFITKGKKQIAVLPVNRGQGNILPGSKRVYPVEWEDGFPHYETVTEDGKVKLDKNQQQIMNLVWANGGDGKKDIQPHFRFGKYTAHLFAVYDDGQRDIPIEAEISFWVIPWRAILVILVLLLLIGFGVYAAVRGTVSGAARGVRRLGRK